MRRSYRISSLSPKMPVFGIFGGFVLTAVLLPFSPQADPGRKLERGTSEEQKLTEAL